MRVDARATRLRGEIADLIAERSRLVEDIARGRDGLRVEQQEGRAALLQRRHSTMMTTWIEIDQDTIAYHERTWGIERRWQAPRTPELILRIEALAGRVLRLRAESRALDRPWEAMVKAAVRPGLDL